MIGGGHVRGMRRIFERVVLLVHPPRFDGHDFRVNGNHRLAEAVEFGFRFTFRRLDHQRAGHGPAQRRRVEPVIHEALGDVFGGDAFEVAQVEDALVRDQPAVPLVKRREILLQTLRDIIRVQDGNLGRLG